MKKLAISVILACLDLLLIGVYFVARVAHPLTEAQILGGPSFAFFCSLQRVGLPRLRWRQRCSRHSL